MNSAPSVLTALSQHSTGWLRGRGKEPGASWHLSHPKLPPGFQYGAMAPGSIPQVRRLRLWSGVYWLNVFWFVFISRLSDWKSYMDSPEVQYIKMLCCHWSRGSVWNSSHIVPLPGKPLRLCVDTHGSRIQALKTTHFSLIFSWPLINYFIHFLSCENKLRSPPTGSFPWFLSWVRGGAPLAPCFPLSLHWSLCWNRSSLRIGIMYLEHGIYTRNIHRLIFIF